MSSNEIPVPRGLMVHLLHFCGKDAATMQRALGLSPQAIRDVMDGSAKFSPLKASRLAALCDLSFEDLRHLVETFPRVTYDPALKEGVRVRHPIRGEARILEPGIGACKIRLDEKSRVISDVPLAVFQDFDIRKALEDRREIEAAELPDTDAPLAADADRAQEDSCPGDEDDSTKGPGASGPVAADIPDVEPAAGPEPSAAGPRGGHALPEEISAAQFKAIVRRAGLTIARTAAGLGVSKAMVSLYISGRYAFPAARVPRLVEITGLGREDILVICAAHAGPQPDPVAKTAPARRPQSPAPVRRARGPAPLPQADPAEQNVPPALVRLVTDRSGLTHHDIARRSGCGLLSLRHFRSGRFDLKLSKFIGICAACGVDGPQIIALMAAYRDGHIDRDVDAILPDRRSSTEKIAPAPLPAAPQADAPEPGPETPAEVLAEIAPETVSVTGGEAVVMAAAPVPDITEPTPEPEPEIKVEPEAETDPAPAVMPDHGRETEAAQLVPSPPPEPATAPTVAQEGTSDALALQIAELRARLDAHVTGTERTQTGLEATVRRLEEAVASSARISEILVADTEKRSQGSTLLQRIAVAVLKELAAA